MASAMPAAYCSACCCSWYASSTSRSVVKFGHSRDRAASMLAALRVRHLRPAARTQDLAVDVAKLVVELCGAAGAWSVE